MNIPEKRLLMIVLWLFFLIFILGQAGCEEPLAYDSIRAEPSPKDDNDFDVSIYAPYAPIKIDIMPLTGFVNLGGTEGASKINPPSVWRINVYVSLLDSFGSAIKSPGVFRFEMYEYVERQASPKGGRIAIWPDIDLSNAVENNKYWRDFLRAYQFNLPFEPASNPSYILQVTFLCPTGKRLSDEFTLK